MLWRQRFDRARLAPPPSTQESLSLAQQPTGGALKPEPMTLLSCGGADYALAEPTLKAEELAAPSPNLWLTDVPGQPNPSRPHALESTRPPV